MSTRSSSTDPVIDLVLGRDGVRLSLSFALSICFGACLVVAAASSAGVLGGSATLVAIMVVVVAVSWWTAPVTALIVALIGFLFANGFAMDAQGTLAWHGEGDLLRLVCLVAIAVTAALLGQHHFQQQDRRPSSHDLTAQGKERPWST